jgi:hypothetical protein
MANGHVDLVGRGKNALQLHLALARLLRFAIVSLRSSELKRQEGRIQ